MRTQCGTVFFATDAADLGSDRGPQVPLPAGRTVDMFLEQFCYFLIIDDVFPPAYNHYHDASDVNWWLAHHHLSRNATGTVIQAFELLHAKVCPISLLISPSQLNLLQCRWYACRPACKVWRGCILRFAKENGWRVPTRLEILRDRFKPIPRHYDDPREMDLREMLGPPDYTSRNRAYRLERLEEQRPDS